MKRAFLLLLFFPVFAFADVYKCVNDGSVSYSEKPCAPGAGRSFVSVKSASVKSASIARGAGGVFRAAGSVNGQPVNFIIDTGSSFTTLSGDLAYRLGVRDCVVAGTTNTANGVTSFCRVTVPMLTVAGFNFANVSVAVNPTMKGEALFGNDLLNQFTINQQGNLLTLSR